MKALHTVLVVSILATPVSLRRNNSSAPSYSGMTGQAPTWR